MGWVGVVSQRGQSITGSRSVRVFTRSKDRLTLAPNFLLLQGVTGGGAGGIREEMAGADTSAGGGADGPLRGVPGGVAAAPAAPEWKAPRRTPRRRRRATTGPPRWAA